MPLFVKTKLILLISEYKNVNFTLRKSISWHVPVQGLSNVKGEIILSYVNIIIPFVGGLGLFIYGMQIMASGLQNAAGSKMKKLLEVLTNNKLMGVLLGAFITAIIQSSSATTVMVVGFVNAGIMNLNQAIGVIMGANIGTTITGWIVSSGEWAQFLSPSMLAPVFVMVGVIVLLVAKKQRNKEIASIVIGLGILFIGIDMMSEAVAPLQDSQRFRDIFLALGKNPLLGVLAGTVVTGIIQSSSASVGILQTLAAAGLVPFNAAVYIIMGQNIGTCVTALLSSIGASKSAKSAAFMHLTFNIIGTIIFSIVSIIYFQFINPAFGEQLITMTQISTVHTLFNVINTIILFPASGFIIKVAKKMANYDDSSVTNEADLAHLDDRVLETPSFAVECASKEVVRLGYIVVDALQAAVSAVLGRDTKKADIAFNKEETIDSLSDSITQYLVKICNSNINSIENSVVTSLIHVVGDMERIGDHCENMAEISRGISDNNAQFSEPAQQELNEIVEKSARCYYNALKALETGNVEYAREVVKEEDQVDDLQSEFRKNHIERLTSNLCNGPSGVYFLDIITNSERISDHALNIAQTVLEEDRIKRKQQAN